MGFGEHAGAGIDQIWKRSDGTSITYDGGGQNGPTHILHRGVFAPPGVGVQMSKARIVDRLARMLSSKSGQLASKIFQRMGAKSHVPHYYSQSALGGGKSYYAARPSETETGATKTMRAQAAVATALWNEGSELDTDPSGAITYTDLW